MEPVNTGAKCEATDVYKASCGCSVEQRFLKDTTAPQCPICLHDVTWYRVSILKPPGAPTEKGNSKSKPPEKPPPAP